MKRKRSYLFGLLALCLILITAVPQTLAYFTGHVDADGSVPVYLIEKTEIQESFKDWVKDVTVENTEGRSVWIRARAYWGQTFNVEVSGSGWTYNESDGWWYCDEPIAAGETTPSLKVAIKDIPETVTEDEMNEFNIAVVYESTPVYYNEDGSAKAADWTSTLDQRTVTTTGGETNG